MTIVCFDGTTLAADRASVRGDLKQHCVKLFRTGQYLVGTVGHSGNSLTLLHWVRAGAYPDDYPFVPGEVDISDYAELMLVDRQNRVYMATTATALLEQVSGKFAASGSGEQVAVGALAMGATARQAVQICIKRCPSCGLGVQTMKW